MTIDNNLQIKGHENKLDEELQSKVLDWLRFPMIVLVVYSLLGRKYT